MIFGKLDSSLGLIQSFIGIDNASAIGSIMSGEISEPGKYVVNENLFYYRFDYTTKPKTEAIWEAHRKYIDIHAVIEGEEEVYFNHLNGMKSIAEYNPVNENQLFEGSEAGMISLKSGFFVLFEPQDVHKTGVHPALKTIPVKKIVFKLKIK